MSFRATLTAIDPCLSVAALSAASDTCRHALCNAQVNWFALISLANRYLVAPALWTAVVQTEPLEAVPDDVRRSQSNSGPQRATPYLIHRAA